MTRLLVFAGSAREGSWNKKLAAEAARIARARGADVTLADLRDYPMPLYDGDLEQAEGLPPRAAAFQEVLAAHDGWLIACPEYNGSITPLLKNTIDWSTRTPERKGSTALFQGRVVGLVSTSPGALGGLRALTTVRTILSNVGAFVVPKQLAVPLAPQAFDEDGHLTEEPRRRALEAVVEQVLETTRKLHA